MVLGIRDLVLKQALEADLDWYYSREAEVLVILELSEPLDDSLATMQ
jgi:hypothetical protein